MSFLDRIEACRRWDPDAYRPFVIDGLLVGRVGHDVARRLADFGTVFEVSEGAVTLASGLADFEARSAAVAEVLFRLSEAGDLGRWRNEDYPVVRRWGDPPLMKMDRSAVPPFGVRGYGVHMNGVVRRPDGLHMWVGRRAMTKTSAPGKLDHLVAGGQPYGLGIRENMIKESAEEAGLPQALAERMVAVGMVTYRCERPEGLRDDVLFCFDLDLPADFVPENTDGEVDGFSLWPIERVLETIRDTEEFKFNVSLVVLDFAVRHGLLDPDQPDYQAIIDGLRLADDV